MAHRALILLFVFLTSSFFSQVGTLQMRLLIKGDIRRRAIKEKNVKVTVNDTLVKYMVTNRRGYTGYLPLEPGEHNICVEVKGYKSCSRRSIHMNRAEGRMIRLKLWKDSDSDNPEKNK
jgi:hypothetical protein